MYPYHYEFKLSKNKSRIIDNPLYNLLDTSHK